MSRAGARVAAGAVPLLVIAVFAVVAPWCGLRDPAAQPDGLVLRDLPPGSSADRLQTVQGPLFVHEWRPRADGGVDYRRGETWKALAQEDLAGPERSDWNTRERYWLGTDTFGRDLLSRLVHGARVSLAIGLLAAAVATGIGAAVGLTAGLAGGRVDALAMRATDLVMSVPRLFLALLLVSIWGASTWSTILVLGTTTWMSAARLVRGEVLSARERDFLHAARAAGAGRLRLALFHLLPHARAPLLVEATQRVADVILLEATLSFLGLGVQPPAPSWGNMIADGRHDLAGAWWVSTLPGLAIALTVIALSTLADGLTAQRSHTLPAEAEPPASTPRQTRRGASTERPAEVFPVVAR